MAKKKLFLVHTSATLVPIFQQLCSDKLKEVDVFNIVDDSLIKDCIARNQLTAANSRRVLGHILSTADGGADRILVTCSSIGPAVEAAAQFVTIPVLRVDQPMADKAVNVGTRIGVVATLPTTLRPTIDLVERRAIALDRKVTTTAQLCEGAFDLLMSGNTAAHDEMVAKGILDLVGKVDVILLAQASMARVVAALPSDPARPPILSSPSTAIDYLATVL